MPTSVDPGHFFQTDEAKANAARQAKKAKNKRGNPIHLSSKLLAVKSAGGSSVFVAESSGSVRRVNVHTRQVEASYTGPTAPLSCLALSPDRRAIFAGCWDKSIHSWEVATGRPARRYTGHSDFVKCLDLQIFKGRSLLLSGSADATIIVWDMCTGEKIHVIKGHSRAILSIKRDPVCIPPSEYGHSFDILASDSVQDIRRWRITLDKVEKVGEPIKAHETSVNTLCFDAVDEYGDPMDNNLWTASSDKTAKCLSRYRNFEAEMTLEHPDFVRDIIATPEGLHIVTACRDEHVRVWNKYSGKLFVKYIGHFDEVSALTIVAVKSDMVLVSVSLDGTVRSWPLDLLEMLKLKKEIFEKGDDISDDDESDDKKPDKPFFTAEEEAELNDINNMMY